MTDVCETKESIVGCMTNEQIENLSARIQNELVRRRADISEYAASYMLTQLRMGFEVVSGIVEVSRSIDQGRVQLELATTSETSSG